MALFFFLVGLELKRELLEGELSDKRNIILPGVCAIGGMVVPALFYLYFNYDEEAEFDFGEVYGSIGFGAFTLGLNVLANTEADEGPGQDFGFGEATYLYADYTTEVGDGIELGFHIGRHEGDFSEAFNGVPGDYIDYNISLSKNGFSFMITSTDLDDAGPDALDNDDIKFVVGYGMDFEL